MDEKLLKELGIVDWGYTEELTPLSYDKYLEWLKRGDHGALAYLGDERADKRQSLKEVFPNCKSALVFLFNYAESKYSLENENLGEAKIASYVTAFEGHDYHFVLKERLEKIISSLKNEYPSLDARVALDVLPVLERDLALRSGLGWFGKNSMLIHRAHGSFNMIGSILLDRKFDFKQTQMETDHCGQCRACADACPTQAIDLETRTLKANLCVSTYTIELFKDAPAPKGFEQMQEIYGCDICQDVCPWNKRWLRERLKKGALPVFNWKGLETIKETFLIGNFSDIIKRLNQLGVREFKRLFASTPLARTGKHGMLKNLLHKKRSER